MKEEYARTDLKTLLAEHDAAPFPPTVNKGDDYGEVDSVMIGADIYGWALSVERGRRLSPDARERLSLARDQLLRSLDEFPQDARPYYQHLVDIADAALAR